MGLYRTGVSSSGGGGTITVDDFLSTTSTNPVQNKVITNALNDKQDELTAGTGIDITNNTISIDSSSMSGYQKFIGDSGITPPSGSGTLGDLKFYSTGAESRELYRYESNEWVKLAFASVVDGNVTNPFRKFVVSTTDIGEGVALDADTIYLVYDA